MILRFVSILVLLSLTGSIAVNLNLIPRQLIDEVNPKNQFTSPIKELDEFRLVDVDSESIVIGARNHVYQLSKTSLSPHKTIEWTVPAQIAEECSMKGKKSADCHNFIRVVARRRNGHLLVCGTHAFSPQCREYEFLRSENRYKSQRDFNGRAITPYDPRANFTYVYSPESNEIFVATVSDFNGNDPLIYKKKIPTGEGIRTVKDDLRVLDHPDFVSSFAYKDFYYVFFREKAQESSDEQIYSRVGRVCKNDNGGPGTTQDRWSSFLKARLNCSVPADVPFYFNELQSVSEPITQEDGDAIVYAVFSTSRSAVLMNAVCAFKMSAIDRVFNHGNFKTQRSVNTYSFQKSQSQRGGERPGKCPKDSRSLGDISFILKNPLMSDLVNAIDQPLLVEGPSKPDLTKIMAIGGVKSVERNQTYDAIYIGRADGKVIKLIKIPQGDSVLIESISVFDNPPTGIQALRPLHESNDLIVVGSDRVAKIPLYHCEKQTSCSRCVALRDPHCAWDTEALVCTHSNNWHSGSFIQNIQKGVSSQCPEGAGDMEGYAINAPVMDSSKEFRQILDNAEEEGLSAMTIAMIIICAVLMATGLGGLIGYRISKWRFLSETAHSSGSSSNGSDYDSYGRARLTRHDSLTTTSKIGGDLYTMGSMGGPKMSDAVSLVLGHQHIPVITSISNAGSGYTTPHHRLEHSAMLITNGGSLGGGSAGSGSVASHAPSCTLPRDYKVKKVYL